MAAQEGCRGGVLGWAVPKLPIIMSIDDRAAPDRRTHPAPRVRPLDFPTRPPPHPAACMFRPQYHRIDSSIFAALVVVGMASVGLRAQILAAEPQGAGAAASVPADPPPTAEGSEFFEKQIRPLLVKSCLECHGEKAKGGLRLDSRAALLAGGDSGPAIALGNPDGSPLVHAVRYDEDPKMPPAGKLADEQIATLVSWIKMGAPWPTGETIAQTGAASADAWKSHWAFQPVKSPPLPKVARADWPQTPLDYFVLAKLEQQGLAPSPQASRRTLFAAPVTTSSGCRRLAPKSRRSPPIPIRTPSSARPNACWPRPTMASAGRGIGWTWPAMPTPRDTCSRTTAAIRTPIAIAIGWCRR